MPSRDKTLRRVMSGQADAAIDFGELCAMLARLGFTERIRGDHHIFTKPEIPDIINVQPERNGKAKANQVRQVRGIVRAYGLDQ
jgi:hypothetical protein